MARMMRAAVVAVMEKSNKYVYDFLTAANFAKTGFPAPIDAASFDSNDVADLWNVAQDDEYNLEDRSLILTNPYYTSLLKDDYLKSFDKAGTDETLRRSIVRELNDFEVMSSSVLASSAPAGAEDLVGFITDKSALAIHTGIPAIQDPESAALIQMVTTMQAENGLTMQFRKHTDPANGAVYGTAEILIGAAVGDANRLARLLKPAV